VTALPVPIWSVSEYLTMERTSSVKHEFVGGHVYAMAGGRPVHNQIIANLVSALVEALRETDCVVYSSDQRVRNSAGDTFFYPDVSVSCDPQFDADDALSLKNPCLVCEVLSPSTAAYDLGTKFERYQMFDSLQGVLFVSSDDAEVELRERSDFADAWKSTKLSGRDATIPLSGLGCTLSLADLYAKISFPPRMRIVE